jgi:hypothetical protein
VSGRRNIKREEAKYAMGIYSPAIIKQNSAAFSDPRKGLSIGAGA